MMQPWFPRAKLGIFLHWGIYAVKGVSESWSFFNGEISYDDYMSQLEGFTAAKYDAGQWAALFRRAGARYAVLTAKHHDGVALWNTELSDLNVVKRSPAGRDLIAPYCDALRREGMQVGLYFSHLDWSHPDYPSVPPHPGVDAKNRSNPFAYPSDGKFHPQRWARFLDFNRGQLRELLTHFGKIDLLWFDGDWEREADKWDFRQLRDFLHSLSPEVILNARMQGHGDYETPEQGIPILPPEGPWEFCMTMNNSWGYRPTDMDYKSTRQIVRTLCECISMGGNLLLDVGPKADGTIPVEQVERLEELGSWIGKHEEAVYTVDAGLPHGHFYGASSLNESREVLYLYVFDRPWDDIAVKGIRNTIRRVSVVGEGRELQHRKQGGASWLNLPGVLWINLPEAALDSRATVVKVELEGPLDLYRGSGGAIQSN